MPDHGAEASGLHGRLNLLGGATLSCQFAHFLGLLDLLLQGLHARNLRQIILMILFFFNGFIEGTTPNGFKRLRKALAQLWFLVGMVRLLLKLFLKLFELEDIFFFVLIERHADLRCDLIAVFGRGVSTLWLLAKQQVFVALGLLHHLNLCFLV